MIYALHLALHLVAFSVIPRGRGPGPQLLLGSDILFLALFICHSLLIYLLTLPLA